MKHLNLIFSLALGTLLMSCDSDAFLSPTDNATETILYTHICTNGKQTIEWHVHLKPIPIFLRV